MLSIIELQEEWQCKLSAARASAQYRRLSASPCCAYIATPIVVQHDTVHGTQQQELYGAHTPCAASQLHAARELLMFYVYEHV